MVGGRVVVDRPLDRPSDIDQGREVLRGDRHAELGGVGRCVERAAVGDVDQVSDALHLDRDVRRGDIAGDVLEAHPRDPSVVDIGQRVEASRRDVDPDLGDRLHRDDLTGLDRPCHTGHRAVAARRREAVLVEEHHAERPLTVTRPVRIGWRHEAPVHVGVAARFVDQERPYVVEVLLAPRPPVEDRLALRRRDAARHDPVRLAAGVVLGGRDLRGSVDHRRTIIEESRAQACAGMWAWWNCMTSSATGALLISLTSWW